jgi:hypothetical protein
MASSREERRGHTTCAVGVSPEVVDAGAEVTLTAKVFGSAARDLRGQAVLLKDEAGSELGSIELTEFDGEATHGGPLVVTAPLKPGQHTWLAVCSTAVTHDDAEIDTSTSVAFIVKPHTTHVVAWDVPSAVEADERFTLKVGIKCANECDLANARFGVYDHEEALVATGALGEDRWPGTTALYVAEVAAQAPPAEGLYTWHVRGPHADSELPHAEGAVSVGVRVVCHPEYLVTIEAVNRVDRTPIEGARVVMHPYRAVTDKRGIAEVRVARGDYKLFVSQTRYLTFGLPVEVTADMSATAELDLEPEVERN